VMNVNLEITSMIMSGILPDELVCRKMDQCQLAGK